MLVTACRLLSRQMLQSTKILSVAKNFSTIVQCCSPRLLAPSSLQLMAQPSAGLKHVVNPKRRCVHCYMVYDDDRVYVFCDKYPRHKQVSRLEKRTARNQMIMTHATQGGKKFRNKNPRGRMHMMTQDGLKMDF